jgi:hypothetical protein
MRKVSHNGKMVDYLYARQGDVVIDDAPPNIPHIKLFTEVEATVVAVGETTGRDHIVHGKHLLCRTDDYIYVVPKADCVMVHGGDGGHKDVPLPAENPFSAHGAYAISRKRQAGADGWETVQD